METSAGSCATLRLGCAFVGARDKSFTELIKPFDDNGEHIGQAEQEIADAQQERIAPINSRRVIFLLVRDNTMVICAEQNDQLVTLARIRMVLLDDTPIGVAARCTVWRICSELVQARLLTTLAFVSWDFSL